MIYLYMLKIAEIQLVDWCNYIIYLLCHFFSHFFVDITLLVEYAVPFHAHQSLFARGFGHPGDRGGGSCEGLERNCNNCHGQSSSTRWCDMVKGAAEMIFVWQPAGVSTFRKKLNK